MTPEITVDLETAEKLKEAGWGQESVFMFYGKQPYCETCGRDIDPKFRLMKNLGKKTELEKISAPTAEEILRELPDYITYKHIEGKWEVIMDVSQIPNGKKDIWFDDESLSNAAAKMYIYLKENNLLPQ